MATMQETFLPNYFKIRQGFLTQRFSKILAQWFRRRCQMLTYRRMTDNIRWMPDHLPVRIAHMSTLCSSELQSDPGHTIFIIYKVTQVILFLLLGVVGWCEGVMYLMSPGRPADIGLQLGKACYPCSR